MTIAPKRPNKMSEAEKEAAELAAAIEDPLTIVTELETINYLGEEIPILDMHSLGSAFDTAVAQFGSSRDTKFYWRERLYDRKAVRGKYNKIKKPAFCGLFLYLRKIKYYVEKYFGVAGLVFGTQVSCCFTRFQAMLTHSLRLWIKTIWIMLLGI